MTRPVVSASEISMWLSCRRKHYYGFHDKIQRKDMSKSLQRGISGHDGNKIFFTELSLSNFDKAIKAMHQWYTVALQSHSYNVEMLTEALILSEGFLTTYRERISEWTIQAIEQENRISLLDYDFAFTPDLQFAERKKNKILDYKYTYDPYLTDVITVLAQLPLYTGALRSQGIWINDALYAFIRYRKLNDNDKKYMIIPANITNASITTAFSEMDAIAQEVIAHKVSNWTLPGSRVRNGTNYICRHCSFLEICAIESSGENTSLIRQLKYKESDYGYRESDE